MIDVARFVAPQTSVNFTIRCYSCGGFTIFLYPNCGTDDDFARSWIAESTIGMVSPYGDGSGIAYTGL